MRRRLRLLFEEAIDRAVGLIPRSVLHPLLRAYRGLRQAASQRWLNEVASAGWYMLGALLSLLWLPLWFAVASALGILLIHIAWRAVRSGTAGLGLALPLFVAAASLVWATGIRTEVRQELYETVAQVIPVFLIASAIDGRVLRQRATRSVRLVAAQLAGVLVIGEAAALLAVSRSDEASIPDWVFPVVVGALIGGGTAMVLSASLPDVDTRSELVVAKDESGDYDEIAAAVAVAPPGTKIKVKPGRYSALKIRTPGLAIVGDGARNEIIVEGRADPLYFAADRGRVEGITFIQEGKGQWFGIDISRGKLTVINCDITCSSLACVGIRGAAAALLRECRIHHGKKDGITCYAGASATIESCEITDNGEDGIAALATDRLIVTGGVIQRCAHTGIWLKTLTRPSEIRVDGVEIGDCGTAGLYMARHATGQFTGLKIRNCNTGIMLAGHGNLSSTQGFIDQCSTGIRSEGRSRGIIEAMAITASEEGGVVADDRAHLSLKGNDISVKSGPGILLRARSKVVEEDNRLTGCEVSQEGDQTTLERVKQVSKTKI